MNLYVSLVASLPLVKMTEPPQMSYGKFISDCTGQIDARNLELLKKLSPVPGLPPGEKPSANPAADDPGALDAFIAEFPKKSLAREYLLFESSLRHSAMKLRAAKLGSAFATPRPGYTHFDSEADRMVRTAFSAPNPVERERILDTARWNKLDELEVRNHSRFNFDTLCAYAIRLQIAGKWAARTAGDSAAGLDRTVSAVRDSDPGQSA
ncbi:MAG: DUF2764 family protein [Lentisphaeria bacterium]|nr:DUF2764 family protein [Lentisphaeria bacterium]